jgi:serine phosphatase RsbU (regulator of sigma subunit)
LLIAVPLSIKSDIFGVMLIEEDEKARRFRSRRLEIINGIAQQAALAIQNDLLQQEMVVRERLETEVQLARQIQQTFIPSVLPAHDNWQIAARWRTARQVGGDFYDVIELAENKLGIFIADVADKGMPAALFMALTRTLVRAAVQETSSPAEALRRVNDSLLPDTQQGMFVTAVYGELDLEAGTFTYVNAGHNPPFWVKTDGSLEKLTRTAIALGVMEQPVIEERTLTFGLGDTLLLYTDGLTEAFSPDGDLFGEVRLLDVMASLRAGTAQEVIRSIEDCLNEFIDPLPLGDDLTMMAIRMVGIAHRQG